LLFFSAGSPHRFSGVLCVLLWIRLQTWSCPHIEILEPWVSSSLFGSPHRSSAGHCVFCLLAMTPQHDYIWKVAAAQHIHEPVSLCGNWQQLEKSFHASVLKPWGAGSDVCFGFNTIVLFLRVNILKWLRWQLLWQLGNGTVCLACLWPSDHSPQWSFLIEPRQACTSHSEWSNIGFRGEETWYEKIFAAKKR
jgi:hypothetical protein